MSRCIFFVSGVVSYRKRLEERGLKGFNELVSYWEFYKKKNAFDEINELATKRGMLMVDSGAYSAANSGAEINLDHFINWQKQLQKECPYITLKAGLDDINDYHKSVSNQEKTDAAGLDIFPTFHGRDPIHYLDWLLSDWKYKTMGLGGITEGALNKTEEIATFLSYCFDRICEEDGTPRVKIHLFGVTNVEILQRFPVYSNDSASITFTGNFGAIWIPRFNIFNQTFDWTKPMARITISKDNNSRGVANAHFLTLPKGHKEAVEQFIKSHGFEIERLSEDHMERKCFCLLMALKQAENYPNDLKFQRPKKEFDIFALA